MSGNVAAGGHGKEMRERDFDPVVEGPSDEERAEHCGDGAFPGLVWTDVRRERMFSNGAAGEVGGAVRDPNDDEGEEEEARAVGGDGVQTDGVGERESDEEKRAGADARGGEYFDESPAGEENEDG